MYKLAIADTVKVPVKFETNNSGKGKAFNFNVICERLPQDELSKTIESDSTIKEVLKRITTGWENQNFVLEADNKPADFNEESFDVMLSMGAIAFVIWSSYLKEVGAKTKN